METFYKEMQAWIRDGQKPHAVFNRHCALCDTLSSYVGGEEAEQKLDFLVENFLQAGLHELNPFNTNHASYAIECHNGTVYQNPRRLHWIKYHAMSPKLKSFYKDLQAWITSGMQTPQFRQDRGLCRNLVAIYCREMPYEARDEVYLELEAQFKDAGLNDDFPFNNGDLEEFTNEHKRYENPARLAWVQRFSDPVLQNSPWLVGQPL